MPVITRRAFLAGVASVAALPRLQRRSPAADVPPPLVVRPRSDWAQGLEPVGDLVGEDVRFLLVHHTAGRNEYAPEESVAEIRGAYELHTSPEKGWADIAYNFLIDRYGVVWEGRAGSLAGAVMADATGGSQGFAQLVCLLGDFTAELPTTEALASLTTMLAWLADRYAIDTAPGATVEFVSRGSNRWPAGATVVARTISGHRDMSATACPGDLFYPVLHNDMQRLVSGVRGVGATATSTTSTTTTTNAAATSTTMTTSTASTAVAAVTPSSSHAPESTTPVPATTQSAQVPASTVRVPTEVVGTDSSSRPVWMAAAAGLAALGGAAGWVIGRRHSSPTRGEQAITPPVDRTDP